MPEPKEIITPGEVAAVAAFSEFVSGVEPEKSKLVRPTFRFRKVQVAAEPVPLPNGTVVQFRVPRTQHNGFAPFGEFETDDEEVAKGLRKVAKDYFVDELR